eukprot:maker-scaffold_5-snap-gene-13.9-mRNA-1 protein AED:0.01 eAED:0.01 QI:73/1/1/1/0/0/2/67/437
MSLSDEDLTLIADLTQEVFDASDGAFASKTSSDNIWLIVAGTLVFFMHCGFSMLEAGSNIGTVSIGGVFYWLFGWGFAYGDGCTSSSNSFIGGGGFAYDPDTDCLVDGVPVAALFFFQYTFAATAATIVSGAVAERITLGAYFVYAILMTGFIFPVVTHWAWSSAGFMSAFAEDGDLVDGSIGLIDFAGSGVVHATGGFAALVGAITIGPREGRFSGKPLKPSSYTLQTLGTFILWFGWYGFNPGSTLVIDGTNMSKAAITTTLAPSAAGVVGIIVSKLVKGHYDLSMVLNCILAGLVSITAGCTAVEDAVALPIGAIGALVYIGSAQLLENLKIDDPIGAAPVHGFAGVWGVLAVGIFASEDALIDSYSISEGDLDRGAQFGMQFVGILLIVLWTSFLTAILFTVMKILGFLRVSPDIEKDGLDASEHGGAQKLHF